MRRAATSREAATSSSRDDAGRARRPAPKVDPTSRDTRPCRGSWGATLGAFPPGAAAPGVASVQSKPRPSQARPKIAGLSLHCVRGTIGTPQRPRLRPPGGRLFARSSSRMRSRTCSHGMAFTRPLSRSSIRRRISASHSGDSGASAAASESSSTRFANWPGGSAMACDSIFRASAESFGRFGRRVTLRRRRDVEVLMFGFYHASNESKTRR